MGVGCRDLVLNVQIVSEEAVRNGLSHHVCELQLALLPFVRLMVRARERERGRRGAGERYRHRDTETRRKRVL